MRKFTEKDLRWQKAILEAFLDRKETLLKDGVDLSPQQWEDINTAYEQWRTVSQRVVLHHELLTQSIAE